MLNFNKSLNIGFANILLSCGIHVSMAMGDVHSGILCFMLESDNSSIIANRMYTKIIV